MSNCSPDKIKAALFEQADLITDIVRQKQVESDNFALRSIPDGGVVERHSNQNSIIYGTAHQASRQYKELDHGVKPLVDGQMKGRTQAGANGIFETDINDIADNACHGQCIIDFAQGFRERTTRDYGIDVITPVKCLRELDRQGKSHILAYLDGFKRGFTSWGMTNYNDNLLNYVIQQSESNTSIVAANTLEFTTGGFSAPPTLRLSIFHLQEWADQLRAEIIGRGFDVPADWMLTVEVPEQDWADAVRADQIARNPTGTVYNSEVYKDDESVLRGRRFSTYGGVKAYFTDFPIRGYYKQTAVASGQPVYNFVRIYPWLNKVDEVAGLVTGVNHQYRQDTIVIDGFDYPVVTLIPHIDPRSFKRYGLEKPLKPFGEANDSVSYSVKVLDGAYIDCNPHNDKVQLTARHEFRLKSMYPEFSGFLAYRHGRRAPYAVEVVPRNLVPGPQTPANPEIFPVCNDETLCRTAECAQCGSVPDPTGECVAPGLASAVINLNPGGVLETVFYGTAYPVTLNVERTGDTTDAATVNFATANGTATAGSDYTATSGTLSWAAGDSAPKQIVVQILATAVADPRQTFTVTLSAPTGDTLGTNTVATIGITDES